MFGRPDLEQKYASSGTDGEIRSGAYGMVRNYNGTFGEKVGDFFYSLSGAKSQNLASASEAEKDRQWQEYMSSTAYQRAAADMKAAGINPATLTGLSGGTAASTPSGASGSAGSGSTILGTLLAAVIGGLALGLKGRGSQTSKRVTYIYHR